ncbi:hypothetical protein PMAYCL1PPCAC_27111, partial [Pristionchus mayeri]
LCHRAEITYSRCGGIRYQGRISQNRRRISQKRNHGQINQRRSINPLSPAVGSQYQPAAAARAHRRDEEFRAPHEESTVGHDAATAAAPAAAVPRAVAPLCRTGCRRR